MNITAFRNTDTRDSCQPGPMVLIFMPISENHIGIENFPAMGIYFHLVGNLDIGNTTGLKNPGKR